MANDFGVTWWGQKWLDSLTHIDYANRIPRGARYARNGSVKEIKFGKDGVIKARVQGSRPYPYKIEISVTQFEESKKELFIKEIAAHPILMSKLLNRELDPGILELADKCMLKVFPTSWKDLGMECSCPDWAVPCKHIAAVIYKISKEIDNNPFVVFLLHGLDLQKAFEKKGFMVSSKELMSVLPTSEFLKTSKDDIPVPTEYVQPDMSRIRNLTDDIINILDQSPAFCQDFRNTYSTILKKCQKAVSRTLPIDGLIEIGSEISLSIDEDCEPTFITSGKRQKKLHKTDAINYFKALENEDILSFQPSVETFFRAYQLSSVLISKGCIVPQIVEHDGFIVIWLPAMMDVETNKAVSALTSSTDPHLITDKNGKPLQDGVKMLLSSLITLLIHDSTPNVFKGKDIVDLFFTGEKKNFSHLGEANIPGNIKSWLSCYFVSETENRPFIQISDKENGFSIEMGFDIKGKDVFLKDILTKKAYDDKRYALLQQLSLLMKFIPNSVKHIDTGASKEIFLTDREFTDFLLRSISAIRLLNVRVLMPSSLKELVHPKPTLRIKKKSDKDGKSFLRIDDLIDFDWQIAIGDKTISTDEFAKLVKSAMGLIRFKESFFIVDENDILKINNALTSVKGPGKMRLLQAAISGEYDGAPVIINEEIKKLIKELTSVDTLPVPNSLKAKMRPYQDRGYSWMYKNMRLGFGSIIADDMGLGKTLQVISLLAKIKEEDGLKKNKVLIAVPASLITNWESELDRFCPTLSHYRYHGTNRNLDDFSSDILLTTYGTVRTDSEKLAKIKWQVMVIDEAQNIKNTDTAQTKAIKSIAAKVKIAMSGTPVENRLSEYWSIMDFVNKGYLDTKKNFIEQFANPIQDLGDTQCAERFKRITAPFMMRRLKTDKSIIDDLPDKISRNFAPTLTKQQTALYERVVAESLLALKEESAEDNQSLFKRQGLILQMILALKQICNHPSLFIKDGKNDPTLSGKCIMLLELVESILNSGEKVLIFTQFKEMGDMLCNIIEKELGVSPLFYHGGCTLKQRTEMVKRFQEIRSERIFVLSLKAAGTGLNLTAASHVIHFDLWWNPAVEQQATDRAYRIGQHKNVIVTRFVTAGTFEERIDKMINKKKALTEMTVATGENWIGKLSDKELKELVSL